MLWQSEHRSYYVGFELIKVLYWYRVVLWFDFLLKLGYLFVGFEFLSLKAYLLFSFSVDLISFDSLESTVDDFHNWVLVIDKLPLKFLLLLCLQLLHLITYSFRNSPFEIALRCPYTVEYWFWSLYALSALTLYWFNHGFNMCFLFGLLRLFFDMYVLELLQCILRFIWFSLDSECWFECTSLGFDIQCCWSSLFMSISWISSLWYV